jgi:hypothetical protein
MKVDLNRSSAANMLDRIDDPISDMKLISFNAGIRGYKGPVPS